MSPKPFTKTVFAIVSHEQYAHFYAYLHGQQDQIEIARSVHTVDFMFFTLRAKSVKAEEDLRRLWTHQIARAENYLKAKLGTEWLEAA